MFTLHSFRWYSMEFANIGVKVIKTAVNSNSLLFTVNVVGFREEAVEELPVTVNTLGNTVITL